jgi:hypothetical protein
MFGEPFESCRGPCAKGLWETGGWHNRRCYGLCQAGDLLEEVFCVVCVKFSKKGVRQQFKERLGLLGRFLFFLPRGRFLLQRTICYPHAPNLCAPAL